MKKLTKTVLLLASSALLSINLNAQEIDKESGLIIAEGMQVVKTNCTVCHSAKFITLQKGDRDTWLSMIRWMQDTQGLWKFDAKTEDTILTYLEKNYPPSQSSRRANLSSDKLPK
ncbi:cytochrome C [Poseidonibacter sp.]|uniref:cytochrome C n=1 Tax=Poseidonibacter sp. TaxID=2321188 RepID=UPI003C76FBA1